MTMTPRPDDFQTRRAHLRVMSDDDLQAYSWRLADLILQLAQRKGLTVREAGTGLLQGKYWEDLPG